MIKLKQLAILAIITMAIFSQKTFASNVSENEVKAIIVKHSIELGIDPALGLSIAKTESKFKHNLRSPYGAVGVFQLLPSTAKTLGVNPYYLSDNIRGGLMYYKMMYKMFGSTEMALAAYNAGPVAVKRKNAIPNHSRGFVNTIMADYKYYKNNPDPAIVRLSKKAPVVNSRPKPIVNSKPAISTTPISNESGAGLSKHSLQMIDVSATKEVKDSLI
ncbi:transglycosylase SLT domain-containing protein [bacterium]|nr:transglycosylase SLT domain-containing protein [bacterium]